MEILTSHGIDIVGQYLDRWMNYEEVLCGPETRTKDHKTLVAVPRTKEVMMYSKPVGYLRLA